MNPYGSSIVPVREHNQSTEIHELCKTVLIILFASRSIVLALLLLADGAQARITSGANRIAASDGEVQPFRKASTTSDLPRNWRPASHFVCVASATRWA